MWFRLAIIAGFDLYVLRATHAVQVSCANCVKLQVGARIVNFGIFLSRQQQQKKMSQFFTLNDVRERNGKNGADTWIVIKDIVYDVTKYLDQVCVFV